MSDPELRDRASDALREAGIDQAPEASSVVVFGDQAPASTAETITLPFVRLWRYVRGRRPLAEEENPFDAASVRNWIGATPTLHPEELRTTIDHLTTQRFITIAQLLSPDLVHESRFETSSRSKSALIDALTEFLGRANIQKHLVDGLALTLDELYTNAVYNAPIDDAGRQVHTARSRDLEVVSPKPVRIEFAMDATRAAISVRDYYGTLEPRRIVEHMRRCFSPSGATPQDKAGGAGLGFFLMLQHASRLVVNIKPGEFTEFIAVRNRNETRRQFMSTVPTLNICCTDALVGPAARRAKRNATQWPAKLMVAGREIEATVRDISRFGAFVAIEPLDPVPGVDTPVEIEMTPSPGQTPVRARAVVRWYGRSCEHHCIGMGIQFDSPIPTTWP